jgi:hypothetical protein
MVIEGGDEHLNKDSFLADVQVAGGVTPIIGGGEGSAGERVFSKIGFTLTPHRHPLGVFSRFWERAYAWMILWAFNPETLQHRSLLRYSMCEERRPSLNKYQ